MTEGRTSTVTTDAEIINLIEAAQLRLVIIAPALALLVAKALARHFNDLDHLDVRVIVDAEPEVYRRGFGEQEALEEIRQAATRNLLDLREQTGVRIGWSFRTTLR